MKCANHYYDDMPIYGDPPTREQFDTCWEVLAWMEKNYFVFDGSCKILGDACREMSDAESIVFPDDNTPSHGRKDGVGQAISLLLREKDREGLAARIEEIDEELEHIYGDDKEPLYQGIRCSDLPRGALINLINMLYRRQENV